MLTFNETSMTELHIEIENLKCHGCANTVRKNMLQIEGVNLADVSLDENYVKVSIASPNLEDTIVKRLAELGYPKKGESNTIIDKAKSYVSCAIGRM